MFFENLFKNKHKTCNLQALGKDELKGTFAEGEDVPIQDVRLTEHQTCPPDYLTESEVITLMEKHGIGTDASIPVHINNICQRNYVSVASGRRLIPTTLGIVLVHGYQKVREKKLFCIVKCCIFLMYRMSKWITVFLAD